MDSASIRDYISIQLDFPLNEQSIFTVSTTFNCKYIMWDEDKCKDTGEEMMKVTLMTSHQRNSQSALMMHCVSSHE